MKNKEYWVQCLGEVLPNQILTEREVENIMNISEMEYEYTGFESHKPSGVDSNPLDSKIKELENKIRIYENALCKVHKADFVNIVGDKVEWTKIK